MLQNSMQDDRVKMLFCENDFDVVEHVENETKTLSIDKITNIQNKIINLRPLLGANL